MHSDNVTLQNACLHDHCGLFETVLTLDLQQLVVFLVVYCHKLGVQIGPKSEVGGPKDPKMYAWQTHCVCLSVCLIPLSRPNGQTYRL